MHALQSAIFYACMIGASIYDIREHKVKFGICWTIFLAGLVTTSPAGLFSSVLGAVLAAFPFYLGAGFKKNGAGDVYLSLAAGFVLGYPRVLPGLFLFLVLYAVYVALDWLVAWAISEPPHTCYPLVPFIAAGFLPVYTLFS